MEHLPGYDEWKARVPEMGAGRGDANGWSHTRMLWWRTYRFEKRNGTVAQWLDTQREIPAFAGLVREAERLMHGFPEGK